MNTKNLSAFALLSAAGFLAGCGSTSKAVKIDHPVHSPLTEQVVNDFRIHTTPPRASAPTVTLDGAAVTHSPDGANKYRVDTQPFTPGTHVLRAVTTMSPSQAFDMTSDEVTFVAAKFQFAEITPTGPMRTVPPGTTPTTSGSRTPGLGGFRVQVGVTKQLLVRIPAGLTQNSTAVITTTGPGVVAITGSTDFTPTTNSQMLTVSGVSAGDFTLTLTAPGFQITSFTGTVVP